MEKEQAFIETYTGKKFYALAPNPQDICLEDIAHALSNICRFNGHVKKFYSVAQHSLNVYDYLLMQEASDHLLLHGLLHDASEAYIADVSKPLKPFIPGYILFEGKIQWTIWESLGITPPTKEEKTMIMNADHKVLLAEAKLLMPCVHWNQQEVDTSIIGMIYDPPERIESLFLLIIQELLAEINLI